MPPIKDSKISPLREKTLLSMREGIRHSDRRLFYQQNRLSLSPLSPRCHRQSPDYQIVLQGGNGDKVLKITCRRKPGTFDNTPNLQLKMPQTSMNKGRKTSWRLSEPPTNVQPTSLLEVSESLVGG